MSTRKSISELRENIRTHLKLTAISPSHDLEEITGESNPPRSSQLAVIGVSGLRWCVNAFTAQATQAHKRIFWMTHLREVYPPALEQYGMSLERILFMEDKIHSYPEFLWLLKEAIHARLFHWIVVEEYFVSQLMNSWIRDGAQWSAFLRRIEILTRGTDVQILFLSQTNNLRFQFKEIIETESTESDAQVKSGATLETMSTTSGAHLSRL